jgi:regulator of protease activity HflC (stomatin/prohibitin superfamily)
MGITAALGIIGALFWLGAIGGLVLAGFNASRQRSPRPGVVILIAGLIGGILLTVLSAGLVLVQPNERAVVFQQIGGGETALRAEALTPGLNWIFPFVESAIIYNVARQEVTMAGSPGEVSGTQSGLSGVRSRSFDGQEVLVDVTVIFTIDPREVNQVHIDWQNSYRDAYVVPQTRSVMRDAVASYTAEDIYAGGRVNVQRDAASEIAVRLEVEGFVLVDLLIRDVTFSAEFANVIEQKQIAEQEVQRAAFLVDQQEEEARRAIVEAEGLADAEARRAEGEASAIVTRATAEAEALRLINEQLSQNPLLIQYTYVQTLSDNVRIIMVPSDSPFLFDTQTLFDQSGVNFEAQSPPAEAPAESGDQ